VTNAIVPQLTARFDERSQPLPDEGVEFWFARDLMEFLGDLTQFKTQSDVIMENRITADLQDATERVYSNDLFDTDS
jgi:DNA-damage-inducible protein D